MHPDLETSFLFSAAFQHVLLHSAPFWALHNISDSLPLRAEFLMLAAKLGYPEVYKSIMFWQCWQNCETVMTSRSKNSNCWTKAYRRNYFHEKGRLFSFPFLSGELSLCRSLWGFQCFCTLFLNSVILKLEQTYSLRGNSGSSGLNGSRECPSMQHKQSAEWAECTQHLMQSFADLANNKCHRMSSNIICDREVETGWEADG